MSTEHTICRPDDIHFCVQCCTRRNAGYPCSLLGSLPDGKKGCLGHNGKRTKDGLTQPQNCTNSSCFPKNISQTDILPYVQKAVKDLPEGEFRMGNIKDEVLSQYKQQTTESKITIDR